MHISLGRPKYPGDEESINGGDRDFAVRVIREGYCALVMEQRCFGELGGTEKGPDCTVSSMAALLIGRTTIGERLWDLQRTLDAAEKRFPEADKNKIICMGNSGGGTSAFFAACLEPRIRYVMPSSYFCSFDDCIGAMHHCACNFVPRIRLFFDMGDMAGLIAPRPMVIVSGREDPIFPQPGVQKAFAEARRMYVAAKAPDNLKLVIGEGGHRFYADLGWEAMNRFIYL
jgi:dienelactone hydrolase